MIVNGIETERESDHLNLITATDKCFQAGKVYTNLIFVFGHNELTCTIIFQRN